MPGKSKNYQPSLFDEAPPRVKLCPARKAELAGLVEALLREIATTLVNAKGTKLEVEAMLLNRDKGFVREGQDVRIKLEAFNFTKYGVIDGTVTSVSNDAVSLNQNQQQGAQGQSALPGAQGPLVFPVRIALSRETIRADGEDVHLTPGMSVSAEIKTGDRRVIEFFLSPLLKLKDEALRER